VTRLSVTAWLGLAGVVAISPIASATNTPTPPGDRQAAFGRSLAIAGDFAFVGEPGGFNRPGNPVSGGSVWIFRRGTPAVWRHNATLSLPAETPSAGFGAALAAEGSVLLVGHVPPGSFGQNPEPGAPGMVHVYTRAADGSYTAAGVLPAPNTAGSQFGAAIAMSGELAYVGAPGEGNGMVHVFRRTATGWTPAGHLMASGLSEGAGFGASVSVNGNRVAVGAPGHDDKGAVFVFARGTDGSWTPETASPLMGRRSSDNARFGATVMLDGDRLLVGAPSANFIPQVAPSTDTAAAARQGGGNRRFGGGGGVGMVVGFERNAQSGAWIEGGVVIQPTRFALEGAQLQPDYADCWSGLRKNFTGKP
jgi:hypothetical protein